MLEESVDDAVEDLLLLIDVRRADVGQLHAGEEVLRGGL